MQLTVIPQTQETQTAQETHQSPPKICSDEKGTGSTTCENHQVSDAPRRESSSWRSYITSSIAPSSFAELELLLLTFNIGIQDATTFPDYRCFASNQTGNTVMLAIAVTIPHLSGELFYSANIGVSLPLFIAGSFITGQLGNHVFGRLNRAWLFSINFLQTVMVFAAATIQFRFGVQPSGPLSLLVISLLAFASGSQVVISRALKMTEISTAMATAAWVDLVADPNIMERKNRSRNRRAFFLVALVAGGFTGAGLYLKAGSAVALLISAIIKAVVTCMFLFNTPDRSDNVESLDRN